MSRHLLPTAILPIALLALAANPPAAAQSTEPATLVLTIDAVATSEGVIRASLCDDPAAELPGPCATYVAEAPAVAGTTTITFDDVRPGRYALQFWHDANSNGRAEVPPERYGYGNDAHWPPSFERTAIDITSDAVITLTMQDALEQFFGVRPKASEHAEVPAAAAGTDSPRHAGPKESPQ